LRKITQQVTYCRKDLNELNALTKEMIQKGGQPLGVPNISCYESSSRYLNYGYHQTYVVYEETTPDELQDS
jgi:hypothetical protein